MHMLLCRLVAMILRNSNIKQSPSMVTLREPTTLKNKGRGKTVPDIAQKMCQRSFIHTHLSTSAHPTVQSRGGCTHEALGSVAAL